jgi:hypothetical protein
LIDGSCKSKIVAKRNYQAPRFVLGNDGQGDVGQVLDLDFPETQGDAGLTQARAKETGARKRCGDKK